MTIVDFAGYARDQVAGAEAILDTHRRRATMCSCGRAWPCSVAQACAVRRDHFLNKLALLEATVKLPIIDAAARRPDRFE